MIGAELHLHYWADDEWHGRLEAMVKSGEFSGRSSAWFSREQLTAFVAALRAYPLPARDVPLIEGGYWSKERPGTLEQCHLRIAVRPHDSRGTLRVQVDLASQYASIPDEDLQHSVTVRFLTDYASVEEFAAGLEQVLGQQRESVVLSRTAE
jgi:hypothetical protein